MRYWLNILHFQKQIPKDCVDRYRRSRPIIYFFMISLILSSQHWYCINTKLNEDCGMKKKYYIISLIEYLLYYHIIAFREFDFSTCKLMGLIFISLCSKVYSYFMSDQKFCSIYHFLSRLSRLRALTSHVTVTVTPEKYFCTLTFLNYRWMNRLLDSNQLVDCSIVMPTAAASFSWSNWKRDCRIWSRKTNQVSTLRHASLARINH